MKDLLLQVDIYNCLRKVGKEMSKVAVVYWSRTGKTEAMAWAEEEGVTEKGAKLHCLLQQSIELFFV